MTAIRVLVADDQRVVREGLAMLLRLLPEIDVVGSASDGEEAVALAGSLRPDVVLMDLGMPHCDGVEATRRLRERQPGTHVIVLTTFADDRSVVAALRAVMRGEAAIDPVVQHHVVAAVAGTGGGEATEEALPDGLTPREAEVMSLIAAGLSNAEIAERLVITEATVKSHVNHLFGKTGVRDRAQAVAYAYRNGLAPDA